MNESFKIKIDVTKIDKAAMFRADSGAVYVDCVAWLNREPGRYGDTHKIVQDLGKEAREAGRKGAIIGNMRPMGGAKPAPQRAPAPQPDPKSDEPDDQIPF